MSRAADGTYTLPNSGSVPNPVVTGSKITAPWGNGTLADMAGEITNSLDRNGKGGMLAPIRTPDGTVGGPAHSFTNDTDTGRRLAAAGDMRDVIGGVDVVKTTSAGVDITGKMAATGAVSGTTGTFSGAVAGTTGTFSGAVSGTTGTFSGAGAFGGALDMNAQKINELADGTAATDAVALGQVAAAVTIDLTGTDWAASGGHGAVRLAAVANGFVVGRISLVAGTTAAWGAMGSLPAGARPDGPSLFPCVVKDASGGPAYYAGALSIDPTAGTITLAYYDNGTALVAPFVIGFGDKVEGSFIFRSV